MLEIILSILDNLESQQQEKQYEKIKQNDNFIHMQVYQQHIFNFCGYHATYNILQMLSFLQGKQYYFYNSVQFWKYVFETQNMLIQYKQKLNLTHEPWRNIDIQHGDFERSYLKPWKLAHQEVDLIVVQYQFGRIMNSIKEKENIAQKIDNFFNYQGNELLIQTYMLGITYHWVAFVATKQNDKCLFYLLDSKNLNYTGWTLKEIEQYLFDINSKRVLEGQKSYSNYELDIYKLGMQDLQNLIILMINCLTGQEKIREVICYNTTLLYAQPLLDLLGQNEQQFLNCEIQTIDQSIITLWAQEYKHSIFSCFKEQFIICKRSQELLQKIFEIMNHIYSIIGEQEVYNSFQQCYNVIKGQIETMKLDWRQQKKETQNNLYLIDSTIIKYPSYLIDLKKVYVREFTTKLHYFYIRLQFKDNIFHPQGGGQPDDIGYIEINNTQYQIKNMYNCRQQQESYIDISYNTEIYNLLLEFIANKKPISQFVNQELRFYHSQLHSAGHLLYSLLNNIINTPHFLLQQNICIIQLTNFYILTFELHNIKNLFNTSQYQKISKIGKKQIVLQNQ